MRKEIRHSLQHDRPIFPSRQVPVTHDTHVTRPWPCHLSTFASLSPPSVQIPRRGCKSFPPVQGRVSEQRSRQGPAEQRSSSSFSRRPPRQICLGSHLPTQAQRAHIAVHHNGRSMAKSHACHGIQRLPWDWFKCVLQTKPSQNGEFDMSAVGWQTGYSRLPKLPDRPA